jgi:hypothetical protein
MRWWRPCLATAKGVASAVNDANHEIGSAVGIAVVGSIFASSYRSALPALSGHVSPAIAYAVWRSPGAGITVASQLGAHGAPLVRAVRSAFMSGFSGSMWVVVGVAAVFAVITFIRAPELTATPAVDLV